MIEYFREPMPCQRYKQNCPFRLSSFLMDSPLYQLAIFLYSIILKNIPKADSHIENSFQIVEKLKLGSHLNNEHTMISLDVVSFFTNVFLLTNRLIMQLIVLMIISSIFLAIVVYRKTNLLKLLNLF